MQQPSVQQLIECQRPVQQQEPLVQPRIVQQSQVQQYPAQPFPVQQPSERQSTMQQPSVQQHIECPRPVQQPLVQPRIVQQPQVRQYQVPQYSEQQPSVQQSAMQQPSVQEHVERHHPVPQPSVQRGQIQQPMQLASAQPPSMQQPLMQPSSLQQQSGRWPSVQARPVQQHPVQQYAEQPNLLPQFPMWASPVQQLSTQQPLRQQNPVGTPPISSEGAAPDVNGQERRVDELPTPQQLTSRKFNNLQINGLKRVVQVYGKPSIILLSIREHIKFSFIVGMSSGSVAGAGVKESGSPGEGVNCGVCRRTDKDCTNGRMVQCDECDEWFHYDCVNVNDSIRNSDWSCNECVRNFAGQATASYK
nr:putative mediator of RNA polymerase II transcription subunit 12 [Aedes albopictus]